MSSCTVEMFGTVTVGQKGQVVIPNEVRKSMWIKAGDKLMVMKKWDMVIWLIKNDDLPAVLKYLQNEIKDS